MLLFLARLSFAAEESPTCGDGEEITLTIKEMEIDRQPTDTYDWTFSDSFYESGGRVIDTTGPTTTIRCPHCRDVESQRWDFQVEIWDDDDNLVWAYGYFWQECPEMDRTVRGSCASNPRGGSAWLALLALTFRRRRS